MAWAQPHLAQPGRGLLILKKGIRKSRLSALDQLVFRVKDRPNDVAGLIIFGGLKRMIHCLTGARTVTPGPEPRCRPLSMIMARLMPPQPAKCRRCPLFRARPWTQ
jgi:hypothetical protein